MEPSIVISACLLLLTGLIVGAAVALIRHFLTAQQWRQATMYAAQLVQAGYQLHKSGQLQKSSLYQRAATLLKARYPHLTDDQLVTLIESTLSDLKVMLNEYNRHDDNPNA